MRHSEHHKFNNSLPLYRRASCLTIASRAYGWESARKAAGAFSGDAELASLAKEAKRISDRPCLLARAKELACSGQVTAVAAIASDYPDVAELTTLVELAQKVLEADLSVARSAAKAGDTNAADALIRKHADNTEFRLKCTIDIPASTQFGHLRFAIKICRERRFSFCFLEYIAIVID